MSNSSEVTVCSNALARLGAAPISSFDDEGKFASICADLWPQVRNALLRAHSWNCCVRRTRLVPLVDKPAFDYAYQFDLPGDWLRTIQVGLRGQALDYQQEGRRVLANVNSLPLVYVWQNEEVQTWDDMLVELATIQMQAVLAYPVTASTTLQQAREAVAEMALKRAKAADGQDNPPEEFPDSPLQRARFRG